MLYEIVRATKVDALVPHGVLGSPAMDERVKRVLAGEADSLEPIHYDPES